MQDRRQMKNTDNMHTKHNPEKSKQHKTQQNKTTLVESSFYNTQPGSDVVLFYNTPEPIQDKQHQQQLLS